MSNVFSIDLAKCSPVNHLWSQLVQRLGVEKAKYAVVQALDLQRMRGSEATLPVLLIETCGLALVRMDSLRNQIGFPCHGDGMVLILSIKEKAVQLLQEI